MAHTTLLVGSWDNGSFSGKAKSDDAEGSFLSMAAPVTNDLMDDFNALKALQGEGSSYDLSIYNPIDEEWERWLVGEEADGKDSMQRTTRNMKRFNDSLYRVFLCAALRTCFPRRVTNMKRLQERDYKPHHSEAKPVALVVSIAPSYFGDWELLADATKGYFYFFDNRSNQYYAFRVVGVRVVPESFGGYALRLFQLDEKGRAVIENGQPKAKKGGASLQNLNVAVCDAGGRTFDIMVWDENQRLTTVKSLDLGLHQYLDAMVADIMSTYSEYFGTQPTRMEIFRAISKGMGKRNHLPKSVILYGLGGEPVDIVTIVTRHMNLFCNKIIEGYQEVLRGGQNLRALLWMGGVALVIEPYLVRLLNGDPDDKDRKDKEEKHLHKREEWVSRNHEELWMANAKGAYAWGVMAFANLIAKYAAEKADA